ncbi:zinc finger protein [Silurus asotus]|uniref:Zinc finger protein n=1 Tax=Silurus asotus TaxID=30991 RepID=A0AAD5AUI1_SILAS|nr:zinc finger protein [Silurus asotus]
MPSRLRCSNPVPKSPGGLENGQMLESEDDEKEILNGVETSVDQETQFHLEPESFQVKNEEVSSEGDVGGSQEAQTEVSEGHAKELNPSGASGSEEWDGPRELEMDSVGADRSVRFRQALPPGATWGPYAGKIDRSSGGNDGVPLVLIGGPQWLKTVTWVSAEDSKNNCVVYSKGGHVWCSTTRSVTEGEELAVCAVDVSSTLASIQLLPQQAAMSSILQNAVNKDIFSCKTCGIWFKSERNLQAHLIYYCSGRPKEPELASVKLTNTSLQPSHTSTFPQCSTSFMGPQALKMHLATHSALKTGDTSPGSSLKCTICDYTADTLVVLQPHILTHLSPTGLRCGQCHFTFQTPRDLSKHQELHRHTGQENKSNREDQNEHSNSLCVASPMDHGGVLESPGKENTQQVKREQAPGANKADVGSGIKAGFSFSRVKSEPSSPRLASSPIQNHVTPAFPVPPFLPHVPFSQDITAVPQASEILAKMSELVHRRLRHGGTSFPPAMYDALVPKGATCFECNIAFSNLDNYLVHKKHYCNGRWQHTSKSHDYSILEKSSLSPKTGIGLAGMLNASHQFEVNGHNPNQFSTSLVEPYSAQEKKPPEEFSASLRKASTPRDKEESQNAVALGSKSPKMSESNPEHNQTTCEACKITFARHENYVVHKQYYCASRHDPPAKRAANNKYLQRPIRTRKRRKMPSPDPAVSHSYPLSMSQDTVESLKDQLHHRYSIMIQGLVPKHPEPSLTVTKSAFVSKCNAIAQEEVDAPIDLSKKCATQFSKVSGLMDYHECALCKISFNKVEDYLSHKQNFCPGAVLDNKAPNMKEECSRNAGANTDENQPCVPDEHGMMNSDKYPGGAKKIRVDEQIWPYYEIKPADYATGIFAPQNERQQSPNEGTESGKEQPMPDGSHVASENMDAPKLHSNLQEDAEPGNESHGTLTPSFHFTAGSPDREISINPKESCSSSPASKTEEILSSNRSIPAALNSKYCRPCDIRFNNLSNFITHKKFYCSSHTTEHVK